MEKHISLSFGNLIAHLVPGIAGLLVLALTSSSDPLVPDWIGKNVVLVAVAFLALALALGLLLDSVRYLLVRLVSILPPVRRFHQYERFPTQGHLEEFDWIIENYYRHHQFCGNLALASVLVFRLTPERVPLCIPIGLTLILGVSAILMYQRTTDILNKAFPKRSV
jgi:hypothetical protein